MTGAAPAATGARSASKRDAASLRADALPDVGFGLFDAVLQMSPSISPSGVGAADPSLSPSLMFEPAETDRRAGVRSRGEDDLRSQLNRYDRTSVDSRKNQLDSRGGKTTTTDSGFGNQAAAKNAISHVASAADDLSFDRGSSRGSSHVTARDHSATRTDASANATTTASFAATQAGVASTGVGSVSGGAETTRTSAMLVGRLLATGQGADADGLRGGANNGVSAANARATEARDTRASRSQTARSSTGRGPRSSGSADRAKNPLFDQLVRSIRLSASIRGAGTAGRQSSARLQLNPPELGRMDVEVNVVGDRARITVKTQTDAARSLVQERASELIAALEKQGIFVERMEVSSQSLTDQQAGLASGFGEPGDPDDPAAHGANRHAGHASRPVEPDVEPVEPALRLESAVAAESRLDIRV